MINRKHEVRIDRVSVADDIGVSVPTLQKYLRLLVKEGFLINQKVKTRDGLDKYMVLYEPIDVPKPPKETDPEPEPKIEEPVTSVSANSGASVFAPVSTGATTRSESDLSVVEDALENKEICPDLERVNQMFPKNSIEEVDKYMEMYHEEPTYSDDKENHDDSEQYSEEESVSNTRVDIESPKELASFGIVPKMPGVNEEDPYMADLDEFIEEYTSKNKEFFSLAFPYLNQAYQVANYTYAAYFMQAEDIRINGLDRVRLFEKIDEYHEMMKSHQARVLKLEAIGPYPSYDAGYKEKFEEALDNLAGRRSLNLSEDSITINVDPKTNHLYIKAKQQNFYELFRDSQYQNLGKAMFKTCLHSCGYVTFKGPNNGDEFVFQVSKNPES